MRSLPHALIASVLAFLCVAAGARRPDVVVFLADDMGWAECSLYGGRDVPMPNLDRLAAAGMTFTHAFVASPSCAPSRAALLTGMEPMRNGAMLNHARPRREVKKWPAYFSELGYETAAIGKTAHYEQAKEYGFDHASHFKYHQDDCIEAAVAWLAERTSEKPLCLIVGTNWPHVPWPKQTPIDPVKVTLPPKMVDTPETRLARARYLAAVGFADRDLGMVYDAAREHLGADTLFLFTADHGAQFPFGKWNCYDAGLRTPLVIAWPGRIKAGVRSEAIVSWLDLLPTLVAASGGEAPADIDGRSFLPVLLGEKAGHREHVFSTHSADGNMNRYPIRALRTRDWEYIRNLDPAAEHHTHVDKGNVGADGRGYWDTWAERAKTDPAAAAIVRQYHTRPAEELYHLSADPWELTNLAADPAHAGRLAEMRGAVDRWMEAQGDKGLETERALNRPNAGQATQQRTQPAR